MSLRDETDLNVDLRDAPDLEAPLSAGPAAGAPARERDDQRKDPDPARRVWLPALAAVALVVAAGSTLRFGYGAELWLDEALSVNIAKLPLDQMAEALRRDGAPPLYYVLLHGWISLVGDSNVAVRALSGIFGVASLPLMWMAGRRLGGPRAATAALLLLASSPFAVHFAIETRMYSLIIFLALLGFLALTAVLEKARARLALVGLAVASGLLALTHYWSLYLIAATLAGLALRFVVRRGAERRRTVVAMAGIAAGGLLFLPWLESFLFQIRHTGTPWAGRSRFTSMFDVVADFAGGGSGPADSSSWACFSWLPSACSVAVSPDTASNWTFGPGPRRAASPWSRY